MGLTAEQCKIIDELQSKGSSQREIAKHTGIDKMAVNRYFKQKKKNALTIKMDDDDIDDLEKEIMNTYNKNNRATHKINDVEEKAETVERDEDIELKKEARIN